MMTEEEIVELLRKISQDPELMKLFRHLVKQARGYESPVR